MRNLIKGEGAYIESVLRRLPPRLAARVDMARPGVSQAWGGPMNGQLSRQRLVKEIATAVIFDRVVETGAYRGTTTEFLFREVAANVDTVEGNPWFHEYSRLRFAEQRQIRVHRGDSRDFLSTLSSQAEARHQQVFFYLDAHWEADLPLREEVEIVADNFQRAVVVIDDFQVPDDPGYDFDDYGPGRTLNRDYLPWSHLAGWRMYYPAARSVQETGARRGCCVLVSPDLTHALNHLSQLRAG